MNLRRIVIGPSLSLVFLLFFMYMTSSAGIFIEKTSSVLDKKEFLGSVSQSVQDNVETNNPVENNAQPVLEPQINAEAAVSVESNLYDFRKIAFEKNSEKKLPIASLTKLMTAVIVLDNYDLSKNITVDSVADSQDPMKQDVKLGDTLPVESFLQIMLVASSNKSAYALAEVIGEKKFVSLMNNKARDIGLKNTFFVDPTGLSSQDVSTANDLASLAEYILKNYSKIGDISRSKEFFVPGFGKVFNTDQLLGEIPEIVCSKTGFTNQARGCLLLVIDNPKNNNYFIDVILGAEDRFSEMKKIINWSSATCN